MSYITVDSNDIEVFHNSLPGLESLWALHNVNPEIIWTPIDGDLHPGQSIWLRHKNPVWQHTDTLDVNIVKSIMRHSKSDWQHTDNPDVNTVISILKKYITGIYPTQEVEFGRVYLHRLKFNQFVWRHRDVNDPDYFATFKRYHLFTNIPDNVDIESSPSPLANTFFLFNHSEFHSYKNSNEIEDLIFCVVDVRLK